MVKKEKSNLRKYIELYVSGFQTETYKGLKEGLRIDIFWPFKFVWFILASIWYGIFGKRRW